MTESTARQTIPTGQKFSYGMGAIAYALPYQVMATFFLFFVTTILHISPLIAGGIVAISVLWDAITDPWIGNISDRTISKRFGRRHQYLLIGGVGTAIGSLLLWSIAPDMSMSLKIGALLVAVLFTKTMNTFYGAPYYALGSVLSNDYDERSSLQAYRATFHIIGMILAVVGIQVFIFRSTPEFPRGQLNPDVYPMVGVAVAVITFIVAAIATWLIPKDRVTLAQTTGLSLRKLVMDSLKNKSFRAIVLIIFLIEVVFQMTISMGTHVNTFTYHLTGGQMGILGLSLLGMSALSQPFWVFICRKFEKRFALALGMILGLIGFVGMPWAHVGFGWLPIDAPNTLVTLAIFSAIAGVGNGAFMTVPFAMVADATDAGEIESNERQEGLYFGLYTFAYKFGIAISTLLAGALLEVIGFDSNLSEQTVDTSYQLAMAPTWLLILVAPVIFWLIGKYKISRSTHAKTIAELASREA